jgi:hypothetical protein
MGDTAWIQQLVGTAELGDQRRTQRLVKLIEALVAHPLGSLPSKLSRAELKAAYRWCSADDVTHAAVEQAVHRGTMALCEETPGTILVLHDCSELDYSFRRSLREQLGAIGDGRGRGYFCHSSVAVTPEGRFLGVARQILHRPVRAPTGEGHAGRRDRSSRNSLLWLKGTAGLPADPRYVDVCDRGADTFEFLEHELCSGRRFVIRGKTNRRCYAGHDGKRKVKLKQHLRRQPSRGTKSLSIGHKPATGNQPARRARVATLQVSWAAVQLRCPQVRKGHHGREPLRVWCVRLWEKRGKLERFLLVGHPIKTLKQALEVAGWYEKRWVQEEWHKCLKMGCGVEALQFTDRTRLEPMIMVLSVVAGWLLQLRDLARDEETSQQPATNVVPEKVVRTVCLWRHREEKPQWSVREFCLALGRLGGHQNRKSDGLPGWITLWRGYERLANMLEFQQILEEVDRKKKRNVG